MRGRLKYPGNSVQRRCPCGCDDYVGPPLSCKECEWGEVWHTKDDTHVRCALLDGDNPCPSNGKRKDCPERNAHCDGLKIIEYCIQ